MPWVTTAILPLSDPGAAASRSSYVRNSDISASMPLASVATEPPNAVTARCCGTEPTISALSAPRIQAGKLNGSVCTFSKPAAFNLASAHTTARLWASVPARRCPISVVSDSTKSKAAGSLSAFCPRLDAVTTNDSEGSASVVLIVAPALAARATATTRMREILPIQLLLRLLLRSKSLRIVFNGTKRDGQYPIGSFAVPSVFSRRDRHVRSRPRHKVAALQPAAREQEPRCR